MILGILTLYANEVSAVYAVRGYFLARAFISAQKFRDGVGNFTLDVALGAAQHIVIVVQLNNVLSEIMMWGC